MSETCPKCGAEAKPRVDGPFITFECGAWQGDELHRTTLCRWREEHLLPVEAQFAASEQARHIAERALWLCCQNEVERQIDANGGCALNIDEACEMWREEAVLGEATDE